MVAVVDDMQVICPARSIIIIDFVLVSLLFGMQLYHVLFNLQVCICSIPVPEAVWNQRTSTNSIPGTLQGQSHKGIKI